MTTQINNGLPILLEDWDHMSTKARGIFPENDGTYTVATYTKTWPYKTERGALKKWAQLVRDDLV